jgi:hypothetical protein
VVLDFSEGRRAKLLRPYASGSGYVSYRTVPCADGLCRGREGVLTGTCRARADEVLSRLELVWGRPGEDVESPLRIVLLN